jgi:alpha-D-ribose 1-methylphosphonate 5-triphosphate synthase subunit PhnH
MNTFAAEHIPGPGLKDPVFDSQAVFRTLLTAMSRPGSILPLAVKPEAPGGLSQTAAAVCLTLLDMDTPLWLGESLRMPAVIAYLQFHCGCPVVDDPAKAAFALVGKGELTPSLAIFNQGTPEYPDRSTTLIIQVEHIDSAGSVSLVGPGIKQNAQIKVDKLPVAFWREFAAQRDAYPLGVDIFLVANGLVRGLPRSITLSAKDQPCTSR